MGQKSRKERPRKLFEKLRSLARRLSKRAESQNLRKQEVRELSKAKNRQTEIWPRMSRAVTCSFANFVSQVLTKVLLWVATCQSSTQAKAKRSITRNKSGKSENFIGCSKKRLPIKQHKTSKTITMAKNLTNPSKEAP